MEDWKINNLEIKNFKSIRDLKIKPARVNLFLGAPNVGKSNILEALSLLQAESDNIKKLIRYDSAYNLFFDGSVQEEVSIITDSLSTILKFNAKSNALSLSRDADIENIKHFKSRKLKNADYALEINQSGHTNYEYSNELPQVKVRKYQFTGLKKSQKDNYEALQSPYGENIFSILQTSKKLRQKVAPFFQDQKLDLVLVNETKDLAIQKRVDDLAFQLPYSLTADTLQRMIFHFAAIHSNKNAVLLFEEPENHSFPAYIRDLGKEIAKDTDNQYFIASHSHYILDSLIENTAENDLAIFVTYIEDYETKVHRLTRKEIAEVQEYGVNIFFNLNHYVDA